MFKFLKDRKKKDNKGFTLVELVIVVAILAILVGLLAPQYTKYVEKTRKAADASNMDEMVKVIKVYAADPANELPKGKYKITISNDKKTGTTIEEENKGDVSGLKTEMGNSIPNWEKTVTKSQKWNAGSPAPIVAVVEVNAEGGTSVEYTSTDTFKAYMTSAGSATGTGSTDTSGNTENTGNDGE